MRSASLFHGCGPVLPFGPALPRSGDWYGRTVNVASRVTDVAEPDTLYATQELCDATREVCTPTSVGTRQLRGVEDEVELFSTRSVKPDVAVCRAPP
jgi:adenylate cyclase